ncbi:erythromycin esterase family protein [Streptomyces sp. HUAS TT11]|uniref:erythromycin esterase family protein n=1 Tax=Streptomyces sp. HUAS TT11 TaxID=3447508 RepID=UPI003F65EB05
MPTSWMRAHTTTLTTIDPAADLTDLEVLRSIVGDARVVAIGEGAHFVTEFSTVRRRLTRFLAERCGFTHFALEYSFAGAGVLDTWLAGEDDRPLGEVSPAAADWGAADLMDWLRTHNATSRSPLRFAGIDVPEAGGACARSLSRWPTTWPRPIPRLCPWCSPRCRSATRSWPAPPPVPPRPRPGPGSRPTGRTR